jgi:AraC-like DNA-binding protein
MDRPNHCGEESDFERADMLSHLLSWVRLRGETVYQTVLTHPWRLAFPAGASHVHYVIEGQVLLRLPHGDVIALEAGDLALLPHGIGHEISHDETGRAPTENPFEASTFDAAKLLLSAGGGGVATRLVGGTFRYERHPLPPVVRALPLVIHLKRSPDGAPDWLKAMAMFMLDEANHPAPGSSLMISRIIDLLVIRTLRTWAEGQPSRSRWLGAAGEERLGRALSVMHERPSEQWSVASLAKLAGMSRSVFADRFARAFGEPPLRYLAQWRFSLATGLLVESDLSISAIARTVGFQSEAGFSRGFKASEGLAPSVLRQRSKG